MSRTLKELITRGRVAALADALGVSANYLFKVKSGARPVTDHLLAHAWRALGQELDLEGSIRQREPKLDEEQVTSALAVVVILAHQYKVAEGDPGSIKLNRTLADVVRGMVRGDHV